MAYGSQVNDAELPRYGVTRRGISDSPAKSTAGRTRDRERTPPEPNQLGDRTATYAAIGAWLASSTFI